MKLSKLWYKLHYILENYYRDHKYMVYLPIFIIIGLVIGVIAGINSNNEIANFIDNCLNGENNLGGSFLREFFTIIIAMGLIATITIGKYWHILALLGLILFGYKCGYLITLIVKYGGLNPIIHILIITIPYFICTSILVVFFYCFITGYSGLSCLLCMQKIKIIAINSIIYLIIEAIIIAFFNVIVPKLYIVIFLN